MPTLSSFIFISIAVYAFTFFVIRLGQSTKEFKQQPAEDQERARKQCRWSLIALPFVLAGTYFILQAPPAVIRAMPVVLYLLLWGVALWLLWRSYRLGIRRDERLVRSRSGKPLRNAKSLVGTFALANFLLAVGFIAILVAIPAFRLPLNVWTQLITIMSICYTLFAWHQERKNAA
ncbi:MAG: protein-S-isoprenylcysteine O-methyltransferase Ste14 [Burkholderiaceae bacterium]|jgi:protein-S-isoprenylcysteine O-methyltransferase Ste14